MRTEIEALKEIRDRISYFCLRTDGKYDPPWAQQVIGIIDDVLITPYRQCKRFGAPFYVEVGTSIVAIRCASNHDVVWRADHSVYGKSTIDWAESVCTRMNQEAHKRERGDAAKLREALMSIWKEVYFYAIEEDKQDFAHLHEAMLEDPPEYKDLRNSFFAIAHLVDTALAAPPRNCDRFASVDEAMEYFADKALIEEWNALRAGKDRDMLAVELFLFTKWLFAPAKEKEGGAK